MRTRRWLGLIVALPLLLAGCAAQQAYHDGQQFVAQGKIDQGLAKLAEASTREPEDAQYRSTLLEVREKALRRYDEEGDSLSASGARQAARQAYQHALAIEPVNERALAGMSALESAARIDALVDRAEGLAARRQRDEARGLIATVLMDAPNNARAVALQRKLGFDSGTEHVDEALAVAYRKPIRIDFRDAPLKQVFDAISHGSGLSFVFDKDVKTDQRVSIFLRSSTIEATVRYLLVTNQLAQQVLDENTVLIYPNTPAKQKDYQELAVRTFFLSNADAKTIADTLKTILKCHDVVADEKLNMVIVRDTPAVIKMAQRLVSLEDVAEPEVMLEVEVLEVSRDNVENLGIAWPSSITVTPLPVGTAISALSTTGSTGTSAGSPYGSTASSGTGSTPALALSDLLHQTTRTLGLSSISATANANEQDSTAKLLTNPRIRVRNHEKAKILIGERVPNITSTATSTGFVSQSVNYLDVGLTLNVEPAIYLDDTVGIKISLEVSSLLNTVTGTSGTTAYEIGTRTASTVLQLKNGETDVLAGLIDSEERTSGNALPGLGNLPVLGRLFGATTDDDKNTEIVLAITPHLVRNIQRPDADAAYFTAGTESNMQNMVVSNGLGDTARTIPVSTRSAPATNAAADRAASSAMQGGMNGANGSGTGGYGSGAGAYGAGTGVSGAGSGTDSGASGTGTGSYGGEGVPYVGGGIAGGGAGVAQMTIQGPSQVKVGDSVTVALTMQADQPLTSASTTLSYDTTKLQFTGVTEGDFMKQGGDTTSFSDRVVQGGQLILADSVVGGTGASAQGTFAVLTFKALAAVSQTSIQAQPGTIIGASGQQFTMTPPQAYSLGVATMQ